MAVNFLDPIILAQLPRRGQPGRHTSQQAISVDDLVKRLDIELNGPTDSLSYWEHQERMKEVRHKVVGRLRALDNQGEVVKTKLNWWDSTYQWHSATPVDINGNPPALEFIKQCMKDKRLVRVVSTWGEVYETEISAYSHPCLVSEIQEHKECPRIVLGYTVTLPLWHIAEMNIDQEKEKVLAEHLTRQAITQLCETLGQAVELKTDAAVIEATLNDLPESQRQLLHKCGLLA